jgi:hypothetical protein
MKKTTLLTLALLFAATLAIGAVANDDPAGAATSAPTEATLAPETASPDEPMQIQPSALESLVAPSSDLQPMGKILPDPYDHIDCSEYDDSVCTWERIPYTCCCAPTGPCQQFCV